MEYEDGYAITADGNVPALGSDPPRCCIRIDCEDAS